MPIIDTATLLAIADRIAYQYDQIRTAFESINLTGAGNAGTLYFESVTATDDPDVEIPLVNPAEIADNDFVLNTIFRAGFVDLQNVLRAMDAHFARVGFTGGWDEYLLVKDERVSDHFNQVFWCAKNSQWMLAVDVFSEGDDTFATLEVLAGPILDFTDGINYGTGAQTNLASGSNFAATQLRVVVEVVGGIGPGMAADLDILLGVKDLNDSPTTIAVTVPAGSVVGDSIDVGTATDRFLDVTGAVFNGDQGTVGDRVTVRNKKERDISVT